MKIRSNYVSNSSSSSYIVDVDLNSKGINCIKLSRDQIYLIDGYDIYGYVINLDEGKEYYLTQFINDSSKLYEKLDGINKIFYQEGSLNEEPRTEKYYNKYSCKTNYSCVYLLKEHDTAKEMTINQFAKEYKKTGLSEKFLVKYEEDGIKLIYIMD